MRLLDRLGNRGAIENARTASTELSRLRLEREEVEIFLQHAAAGPAPAPTRVSTRASTRASTQPPSHAPAAST